MNEVNYWNSSHKQAKWGLRPSEGYDQSNCYDQIKVTIIFVYFSQEPTALPT